MSTVVLLAVLVLVFVPAPSAAHSPLAATPITIDPSAASHPYDGHGALSAGASSRLLFDYPEPSRSDILDYLFLPNFGAALHLVKVEIGGDCQSTDGTEASHMHTRDDLNCNRGYEYWLLEEARKRNPDIRTYALSWGVPFWVGNQTGYYCDDNIAYHLSWMKCVRDHHPSVGNIDFIGNWNERPYGPPSWTKQFRAALNAGGFSKTKIVLPDGRVSSHSDIFNDMASDPEFAAAVDVIGSHYPCNAPIPELFSKFDKPYWSSEDYSTVGDWKGAGCWGRLLNQNYLLMNQTSTIAWSLIWAVYSPWVYFGNGLMYSQEPWSGSYTVNTPIWTTAHTTQFTQVGWRMLLPAGSGSAGSSGFLAQGGSFVTYVHPSNSSIYSIVIEKLEGDCLRCKGGVTQAEQVAVTLPDVPHLPPTLQLFSTNETHQFVRLAAVPVPASRGTPILLNIARDTIYTLSSYFNGQSKAGNSPPPIPPSKPFPLPYADSFDNQPLDTPPRYLAQDGGSWSISESPDGNASSRAVMQEVPVKAGVNGWGRDTDPVVVAGDANWTDITVAARAFFGPQSPQPPPPPPPPPSAGRFIQNMGTDQCLDNAGRKTDNGNPVDTYTCVGGADNEHFAYDAASGQLTGALSKKCVSAGPCPQVGLCLAPCAAAGSSVPANQSWAFNTSGASLLQLRSNPELCATAAQTPKLDAPITLTPCASPPSMLQRWEATTTPASDQRDYVGVCARLVECSPANPGHTREGYCINVYNDQTFELHALDKVLSSGTLPSSVFHRWISLAITCKGDTISASVDGEQVAEVQDTTYSAGRAGMQSSYRLVWFDDFNVTETD